MKKTMKRMMSLLIAALLALSMAALAEEPEIEVQLGDDFAEEGAEEMSEEAPANETVSWCFIVGDELYATQEAREGEAIVRPEDPTAPEGMVFAGWALEDGTALFVDADGDGEADPVIAHVDALITEVNALAVFEAAQEGLVEEAEAQEPSPLGEGGTEQSDVTEEVAAPDDVNNEDEGEEETTSSVSPDSEPAGAYQPDLAENSPLESFPGAAVSPEGEASEATQKPSPDGEGGATAPDEVSSPDDMNAEDEGEEETTSSVTADAATEGAYQPDLAENSPLESFPGAAVSPKGEALETEEPSVEAVPALPTANALTYTGEAQALVSGEGWLYSLDGESYGPEIPTAVDAGEYTVYFKAAGEAEAQALTVVIAKADVVFIAPVAAATGDA